VRGVEAIAIDKVTYSFIRDGVEMSPMLFIHLNS
jgi:hypothetical protein